MILTRAPAGRLLDFQDSRWDGRDGPPGVGLPQGRAKKSFPRSKSFSHRCQSVYLILVVVVSAAVVVIDTPNCPNSLFRFDYGHDNDRECDPDNEPGKNLSYAIDS